MRNVKLQYKFGEVIVTSEKRRKRTNKIAVFMLKTGLLHVIEITYRFGVKNCITKLREKNNPFYQNN